MKGKGRERRSCLEERKAKSRLGDNVDGSTPQQAVEGNQGTDDKDVDTGSCFLGNVNTEWRVRGAAVAGLGKVHAKV